MSAQNGSRIVFEIPGFGVAVFKPLHFTSLLDVTKEMDVSAIVRSLENDGWDLAVMAGPQQELTRIEWLAVYGEANGYGEA
jgi:hypothetical protein